MHLNLRQVNTSTGETCEMLNFNADNKKNAAQRKSIEHTHSFITTIKAWIYDLWTVLALEINYWIFINDIFSTYFRCDRFARGKKEEKR